MSTQIQPPTQANSATQVQAGTLLRFSTAGSVDDGKSTLIGRLLLDTGNVTTDQLEALEQSSRKRGHGYVDLALLTDGLKAEREQGITIDVAYRYFTTDKRKFILADTPGHEEYTRNMVTGASNAQVSLILVDARQGIMPQTRRHYGIASLLGHSHVIFCINKMDLVNWDAARFGEIRTNLEALAQRFLVAAKQTRHYIPLSALHGDNVVKASDASAWYTGAPLLQLLEQLAVKPPTVEESLRLPIQWVIRPQRAEFSEFRGYAGRIASGQLRVGQAVKVLPSEQTSTVTSIQLHDVQLQEADAGRSVTVRLANDIDISRGDILVDASDALAARRSFAASICWMDKKPLQPGTLLLLQHGMQRVKAKVVQITDQLNVEKLTYEPAQGTAKMNDIVTVQLQTAAPLAVDIFAQNTANGRFILIDEGTHNTLAAGMVSSFT